MKRADHHLVQRVLDGDIDRNGFEDFQERLRKESGLVSLYTDYARLQHTLHEEMEGAGSLGGFSEQISGRRAGAVWLVAAAALVLGVIAWWAWSPLGHSTSQEAAVLTFSLDATWNLTGVSRVVGGATGVETGGTLELSSGRAAIALKPSVSAVIEGPAKIHFTSADSLHLEQGRGHFRRAGSEGRLNVTTPRITAVDSGTEFDLETWPSGADELRVLSGKVMVSVNTTGSSRLLAGGETVRITASGVIETQPSPDVSFATGLGRFHSVVSGDFAPDVWRVRYGRPTITPRRIEGANFSTFMKLPEVLPSGDNGALLLTVELGKAFESGFHTDGWAGISLYEKGRELLFFGDAYGSTDRWSLDVKQGIPAIPAEPPVSGEKRVTLRYEARSGQVTLHEGGLPLSPAFCTGKLPPGTRFDEVRIAASAIASLAVNSLHIRTRVD